MEMLQNSQFINIIDSLIIIQLNQNVILMKCVIVDRIFGDGYRISFNHDSDGPNTKNIFMLWILLVVVI